MVHFIDAVIFPQCMFELWAELVIRLIRQSKHIHAKVVEMNAKSIIIRGKMGREVDKVHDYFSNELMRFPKIKFTIYTTSCPNTQPEERPIHKNRSIR